MAETTARQFMYGVLVLAVVMVAGVSLIAPSISNSSDLEHFNRTINRSLIIEDKLNEIQNKVDPTEQDKKTFGDLGVVNDLIESTVGVFSLVWESFKLMNGLIEDLSEGAIGIPIPGFVILLLSGAVIILISFAIMSAWFKWRI